MTVALGDTMKDFESYCAYVDSIIVSSKPIHHKIKKQRINKMSGWISSNRAIPVPAATTRQSTGVQYKNASFDFIENISVRADGRGVDKISYIYEFECWNSLTKLYFRYEKDPEHAEPNHPLHHLHVDTKEPRYPTAEVSLEQIIEFLCTQLGCGQN